MAVNSLIGDVRAQLQHLFETRGECVDCVVTSPPYWGLRDYGVEGQIGLEPTLGAHLDVLVEVFGLVRQVMKPEATLWLNYGDCYASAPNGRSAAATKAAGRDDRSFTDKPMSTVGGAIKPKDLCLLPSRLVIALQEDGWWVRSEIIWAKPNPMPDSSGRYRPSTAHEKIFLLTKSAKATYDADAVRMPASSQGSMKMPDGWDTGPGGHGTYHRNGREKGQSVKADKQRAVDPRHEGHINHEHLDAVPRGAGRLLRNYEPDLSPIVPPEVMQIATRAFSGAHFATFPPTLVAPLILAGCPKGGLVLDPFGGAGTTGLVADRFGRDAIMIELTPDYAAMARRRIEDDAPLLVGAHETQKGACYGV